MNVCAVITVSARITKPTGTALGYVFVSGAAVVASTIPIWVRARTIVDKNADIISLVLYISGALVVARPSYRLRTHAGKKEERGESTPQVGRPIGAEHAEMPQLFCQIVPAGDPAFDIPIPFDPKSYR